LSMGQRPDGKRRVTLYPSVDQHPQYSLIG
jgi:hypothetical protein